MKFIITLLLIIASAMPVFAQNEAGTNMKGKTSMSFDVTDLELKNYKGGIGGRKWMSDRYVLFLSLDSGFQSNDSEEDSVNTRERNNTAIGISVGFEKHFGTKEKLSPYYGIGLKAGYSRNKTSYKHNDYENKYSTKSFACNLFFGVEYWLIKRISLAAQYDYNLINMFSQKRNDSSNDNFERTDSGYVLGSPYARLTLSFYIN